MTIITRVSSPWEPWSARSARRLFGKVGQALQKGLLYRHHRDRLSFVLSCASHQKLQGGLCLARELSCRVHLEAKMVRFSSPAALVLLPLVSAQLNELAQKAGKKYFGTATDTYELANSTYFGILTDKREFGQLTPSNGQKVAAP